MMTTTPCMGQKNLRSVSTHDSNRGVTAQKILCLSFDFIIFGAMRDLCVHPTVFEVVVVLSSAFILLCSHFTGSVTPHLYYIVLVVVMKIETPQILWQNGSDAEENKPAPLYSVTMLESGFCQNSLTNYGHILATSGNSSDINLWKLSFHNSAESKRRILETQPTTKIEHMLSLTRHERSVNAVAFSPDGLHLATAGDGGSILIWSVPPSKRGNQNGRHFWSTVTKESDLKFRLVGSTCEGINDISWSPDSKRFIVGSIDHTIQVFEDQNYDTNMANPEKPQLESQWRPVYRNSKDHTHFVQGVAFDPLGVYVASMGSDRTVRVYTRKTPPKSKKKVLRPTDAQDHGPLPPPEHAAMVQELLLNNKFELGKSKTIKYREFPQADTSTPAPKKQNLFADESTVESFFRRLNWTADGAFLITPCGLWHGSENDKENTSPSFATLLFARHQYDKPYKVLLGHEKVRDATVVSNVSPETNLAVHHLSYHYYIRHSRLLRCDRVQFSTSCQSRLSPKRMKMLHCHTVPSLPS